MTGLNEMNIDGFKYKLWCYTSNAWLNQRDSEIWRDP